MTVLRLYARSVSLALTFTEQDERAGSEERDYYRDESCDCCEDCDYRDESCDCCEDCDNGPSATWGDLESWGHV